MERLTRVGFKSSDQKSKAMIFHNFVPLLQINDIGLLLNFSNILCLELCYDDFSHKKNIKGKVEQKTEKCLFIKLYSKLQCFRKYFLSKQF